MSLDEELKMFIEFKKNYVFNYKEIIEDDNCNLYCDGLLLKDENGYIGESDKWINVGYNIHNNYSKLLSNLFPYEFEFRGIKLYSIESFFQGIKFKDKELQKQVLQIICSHVYFFVSSLLKIKRHLLHSIQKIKFMK